MSLSNQSPPHEVSDEQLSAFLDAELPAAEMEAVREQISRDENLANRLAELAMVDTQVASHYRRIDEQPMPEAITRLLSDEPPTNNVIAFPAYQQRHRLPAVAENPAGFATTCGHGRLGSAGDWFWRRAIIAGQCR
jgi:anti-sigma factor RsiW